MVSRRSVLVASGVGVASALAGCSGLDGESSGSGVPVRFGRGASAPGRATVVAFADSAAGDAARGRLESSSVAFERADGELVVVSYHRVVVGDSGWRYAAVGATHDWTVVSGAVTNVETNMTTVEPDSPDAAFRLASERGDRTRSWRVQLPEPSTRSVAFRFRTAFEPATELWAGDGLVTISGRTELTDGSFLDGRETVATEHALVYGDTPVANE